MKSTAYVICINDDIKGVVIDDKEFAKKELKRMKENHRKVTYVKTPEDYDIYYWHLHEVPILSK